MSGINNVFSFILFFFNSSFLVPNRNENEWRRPGVSLTPLLPPSQMPPPSGILKGTIHSSPNRKRRGICCASLSSLLRSHSRLRRGRVDCVAINPSTKAEKNIVHLLPFFPAPVASVARTASPPLSPSPSSCVYVSNAPLFPHLRHRDHPPPRSSATAIIRRPSTPLNLFAIPILSCIYAASVVILPLLCCGPHHIIFHRPT